MVDKALILRKIAGLDLYLDQISEFSTITTAAYREDWKTQRVVERTLQMMIETCSDVANHIISDKGMRTPESYADTYRVLLENQVIDVELASTMEKMVKFRNVVVHQYEAVDAEIVVAILRKHLNDFGKFRDAVVACLKET